MKSPTPLLCSSPHPCRTKGKWGIIAALLLLLGCNRHYPALDGIYIENRPATLERATAQGYTNASDWVTNAPIQMVISNGAVYTTCGFPIGGSYVFKHRIKVAKKSTNEYAITYLERTIAVVLDAGGFWMTIPESTHAVRFDRISELRYPLYKAGYPEPIEENYSGPN
jgi:hypothetical protein